MFVLALPLLLLSAPAPEKPRVAVLAITPLDEASASRTASMEELVLTELSRSGALSVIGRSDLASLLGLERQRQFLGCNDNQGCVAEIGAALGAPYLVSGTVSRTGALLRVDLKLLEVASNRVLAREGQVVAREEQLYEVVAQLAHRLEIAIPGVVRAPPAWPFVVGAGLVVGATGGVLMGVGAADAQQALLDGREGRALAPQVVQRFGAASTLHDVGVGLAIGGGALTAVGVVLIFVTGARADSPAVALMPLSDGAVLSFGGRF